jgi:hypothetical protein
MHSPFRLVHALHFGLSPLQPSFLPTGKGFMSAMQRADPQWHPQAATITLRLLVGFVQSDLPLQKSHAISVFFLNLRKGLSSSSKLLAFRFPL